MRRIYTTGETVLDIILRDTQPQAARPGGSMLNSAVSLGRLGVPVTFISEYGCDPAGEIIESFLELNGVTDRLIHRHKDGGTAIALAFLNENGDAKYSFYKKPPAERFLVAPPGFNKDDILLFGSFFAISPEVRTPLLNIINKAKQAGAIIIYDPNFRSSHLPELEKLLPCIKENIALSDIMRASDEDIAHIFNIHTPVSAYEEIKNCGCDILIYTAGSKNTTLMTDVYSGEYSIPETKVVSTVGAGDSFNAGIIYSMIKNNINKENLQNTSPEVWRNIIKTGISFGCSVCGSFDNYIKRGFNGSA